MLRSIVVPVAPLIAPCAWLVGVAATSWLLWTMSRRSGPVPLVVAAAWALYGLVLLALALVGVPPSPAGAAVVLGAAVIAHRVAGRRGVAAAGCPSVDVDESVENPGGSQGHGASGDSAGWAAWLVVAVAAVRLGGHLVHWPWTSPWSWDFFAVWGFKARHMLDGGGLWRYLQIAERYPFSHGEYPPLVSVHLAAVSWPRGDGWLGWLPDVVLAAAVIGAWFCLWRLCSGRLAGAAMLLLLVWSPNLWGTDLVGLADRQLALMAGVIVAVLLVEPGRATSGLVLTLLAGLSLTKNEGLVFAGLLGSVMAVCRGRGHAARVGLAALPAALWLGVVAVVGLRSDRLHGPALWADLHERAVMMLRETARLMMTPDWGVLAAAAAIGVVWVTVRGPRRLVAVAVLLQAAIVTLVVVCGVNDLRWQLATAWPRLLVQLLPAGLACFGWAVLTRRQGPGKVA